MQEPNQEQQPSSPITTEMLAAAEKIIGLTFTDSERELMIDDVRDENARFEKLRTVTLDNHVPPAFSFDPRLPGMQFNTEKRDFILTPQNVPPLPADLEAIAFWPVTWLSHLIRTRQITATDLTQLYLDRLKRYDPVLRCVITLTEELALEQAKRADEEIAAGHYRGLLHGIPWGCKDLFATRGIRTTWGSMPYKEQMIDMDATVVQRLTEAGAILVAKLSVGELAWGDVWYDATTKNPWNTEEGSSGSSAGSASATVAGLVGFSIGTETLGSIVSPSTQCRVTGLRPTFGRVSRHGAMALCWTLDKIGPICRTVEDCALVFNTIYGPDGHDLTVIDYPFNWPVEKKLTDLRVGYLNIESDYPQKALDMQSLEVIRSLGVDLIPIELPTYPVDPLYTILEAEAAAAFDELTRSNRDDLMVRQIRDAWPNVFRTARFIPAVEYIQANRIRTLSMMAMAKIMQTIDVYIAPYSHVSNLVLTNFTGHPCVVVPNGVTEDGKPSSISFMGNLYGESEALTLAKVYQDATDFHRRRPTL